MFSVPSRSANLVRERQDPLRERYRALPEEAWITDRAETRPHASADPFCGAVTPGEEYDLDWRYGNHHAVGGYHDAPNPGEILSAALACCLESSTRLIAERLGVAIAALRVTVESSVDVRGTLAVDRRVPVGFQQVKTRVRLRAAPGTDPRLVERLVIGAERSCVVLQTLRQGVNVTLEPHIEVERGAV